MGQIRLESFIIFTVLGLKTNYITKYNNVISQTTSNRNLMTGGNFPKLFLGMLEDYVLKYFLYFSELLFGMYVRYVESGIHRSVLHLLYDFHRLADANLRCFLLLYKGKWYLSSQ